MIPYEGYVGEDEADLRAAASLVVSSPLALDRSSATPGDLVRAQVTYSLTGSRSLTVDKLLVTFRPPGGTHLGGPFLDASPWLSRTTLQPGAVVAIDATRSIELGALAGTWEAYSTWRDTRGRWHDGPSVTFEVAGPSATMPDAGAAAEPDAGTAVEPDAGTAVEPDAGTVIEPDAGTAVEPDAGAVVQPDAGAVQPDAGAVVQPDAGTEPVMANRWLSTSGNKIVRADGTVWAGRGFNLPDTRGCDACSWNQPNVAEVKRRIDEAVDVWHATFLRLDLESFATAGGRVQWQQVTQDSQYLADIKAIVDHVGTKPGTYIQVSLWVDPTFSAIGWPTTSTLDSWKLLAETFRDTPQVLFGLSNEPQANYSGSLDADCWAAMNTTAQAIRDVEDSYGTPHHIISVQGTRSWSRVLDYYVTHPIAAGGGGNIAYETHVYDPASTFQARFVGPSATLPVIIGEFGPVDWAGMALADCATLMDTADALQVPWLAWTFHMRCPPNLLEDASGGGCGVNMVLKPTAWGQLVKDHLATP